MKRTLIAIVGIIAIVLPAVHAQNLPFACFADGEVFKSDGTPVNPGTNVKITNMMTGEVFNTTTGYPNYPPVEQYNNDYKSVFVCTAGTDKVSVRAWNGTHYGYGEVIVPKDSQALLNITLNTPNDVDRQLSWPLSIFERIIGYFTGKEG